VDKVLADGDDHTTASVLRASLTTLGRKR
jgi:Holliday junction DNA helicase RuvA